MVRELSKDCPVCKSSVHFMKAQSNKQTMIIVNIYKEATFVKFQTIQPKSRSRGKNLELSIDWLQVNLAWHRQTRKGWGGRGL